MPKRASAGLRTKSPNPTHGSGWMLQDFLYKESPVRGLKSHQRELVDGSDRLYIESVLCLKLLTARILDYREQLGRGSEQSTNFRGWDLASSQWFIQSREDLKHPPTAVGGIWTFCAKLRCSRINDLGFWDSIVLNASQSCQKTAGGILAFHLRRYLSIKKEGNCGVCLRRALFQIKSRRLICRNRIWNRRSQQTTSR